MHNRAVVVLLLQVLTVVNLLLLSVHPGIINRRQRQHAGLGQNGAHHPCHRRLLLLLVMMLY